MCWYSERRGIVGGNPASHSGSHELKSALRAGYND